MLSSVLLVLLALSSLSLARIVHYDWTIGWTTAAPDGFSRPVIGINGQWPCPTINVQLGDRLIINVHNDLGNQSTSIHWHGFFQQGTPYMDGVPGTTQCPIPPGGSMTYNFLASRSGTYWYHSHYQGQYPDGLLGPLIVHDASALAPYGHIDEERIITLTDWYHEQMPILTAQYESAQNELDNNGTEPTPDLGLINFSPSAKIYVQPNKTYLFRVICVGNWPGHAFLFDGHAMTVVEVDGVWLDPYTVGSKNVRIATGQRMSVLVHTKPSADTNYALWDTMDVNMLFFNENKTPPTTYNPNVTAYLMYNDSVPLPAPPVIQEFDFADDVAFVPADQEALLEPVDEFLAFDMNAAVIDGISRFVINGSSYSAPSTPSLYTAIDSASTDLSAYGTANPFVVPYGSIVQIAINNYDRNLHPFHLHGHNFQVLQRTYQFGGYFDGSLMANVSSTPVKRDTIMVQNEGHVVIRFRADNPGTWLLHCHIEWHVEAGLMGTMLEGVDRLGGVKIPDDQKKLCGSGT
ncbi:MAG: hypothetical protein MMC23_005170 [Stictis urceolatum]|nr:hypothetical protein [Stictis urceolata]